jgi:hypothetical protein
MYFLTHKILLLPLELLVSIELFLVRPFRFVKILRRLRLDVLRVGRFRGILCDDLSGSFDLLSTFSALTFFSALGAAAFLAGAFVGASAALLTFAASAFSSFSVFGFSSLVTWMVMWQ